MKKKENKYMFLKDSKGQSSASFTFALIAFIITSLSVILGIFENVAIGEFSMSFRSLDASIITAYLVPVMTLYFGRRWTEAKFNNQKDEE